MGDDMGLWLNVNIQIRLFDPRPLRFLLFKKSEDKNSKQECTSSENSSFSRFPLFPAQAVDGETAEVGIPAYPGAAMLDGDGGM